LANDQPKNRVTIRTQGHPDSYLRRSQNHCIRHNSVKTERRQQQRSAGEDHHQFQIELPGSYRRCQELVHGSHTGRRHISIHGVQLAANRSCDGVRLAGRPDGLGGKQQRGVRFGRPRKINTDQARVTAQLLSEGKAVRDIARTFNVHEATIYRLAAAS
jgi:hypothetical protein